MLKQIVLAVVTAGMLVGGVGAASAEETSGKVQAVNGTERSFTLEDGTQMFLAEGISLDSVKEGTKVKVTYEERDGKKVATSVEETKD